MAALMGMIPLAKLSHIDALVGDASATTSRTDRKAVITRNFALSTGFARLETAIFALGSLCQGDGAVHGGDTFDETPFEVS
jgi:hypothetical protein